MKEVFKSGDVVSTSKHSHNMTVSELTSEGKVICMYFIDVELHTETHDLKDLTLISC